MEKNPQKKRKSDHESRKEKEARQREEAALSCAKITIFCVSQSSKSTATAPYAAQDEETTEMNIESVETKTLEPNFEQEQKFDERFQQEQEEDKILQQIDVDLVESNDSNSKEQDLQEINLIDFFLKPRQNSLNLFFSFYPVQPAQQKNTPLLPFDDKIFHVKACHSNDQIFNRNWLSYNVNNEKLYCSVCLAFTDGSSIFCQGFDRYRHLSQTLGEHEKSNSRIESVKTYIAHKQERTIETMLFEKQLEIRKKENMERRKVLSGVIDVIKLIGKQGLAFRGTEEGAYSLDDASVNHGNFLEIFFLLSNYDENLAKHVKRVTEKSKYALEERGKSGKKGRGSQVTFLSKTTVTKIINIIKLAIQTEIANEIKQAKFFSVLMDTTMDVSSYDQCVIVLRYLFENEVNEKVIGLKCVESTTGKSLFNTLLDIFNSTGLAVENCIVNAFNGASNMSGQYSGVSSRLKDIIPNHLHTWCYAHVLNLVMSDTAQCLPATISFFELLQQTRVFIKADEERPQ